MAEEETKREPREVDTGVIPAEFREGGGLRTMTATVVSAKAPCSCGICTKSKIKAKRLHIELKPTNQPKWKNQNEWFGLSDADDSAFFALVERLRKIGVACPAGKNIGEVIAAMGEAEWAEEEKIGRTQSAVWMPQRLL